MARNVSPMCKTVVELHCEATDRKIDTLIQKGRTMKLYNVPTWGTICLVDVAAAQLASSRSRIFLKKRIDNSRAHCAPIALHTKMQANWICHHGRF